MKSTMTNGGNSAAPFYASSANPSAYHAWNANGTAASNQHAFGNIPNGQMPSFQPTTSPIPPPFGNQPAAALPATLNALSSMNPQQLAHLIQMVNYTSGGNQPMVPTMPNPITAPNPFPVSNGPPQNMTASLAGRRQQHNPTPILTNMNTPANQCGPASPCFPSSVPTPPPPPGHGDVVQGVGTINWLSSQAGLLQSDEHGVLSFQLKDFCDQAVHDFTTVLRPGFRVKYQAAVAPSMAMDGLQTFTLNFIVPIHGDIANRTPVLEADLITCHGHAGDTGPPQQAKDPYHLDYEQRAIPLLLSIFQQRNSTHCQLGQFHQIISNCGDDELYKYIGTSSLKRRQFLERRTHLFHTSQTDLVSLQPAYIYTTITALASHLLRRGGACLMQDLFEHFNSCAEVPLEARDTIGKTKFLQFLTSHPWIFAVFPTRVFVSVRRQLPVYDYPSFINEHFPDMDSRSSPSAGLSARPVGMAQRPTRTSAPAQFGNNGHQSGTDSINSSLSMASTTTTGGRSSSNTASTPGTPMWPPQQLVPTPPLSVGNGNAAGQATAIGRPDTTEPSTGQAGNFWNPSPFVSAPGNTANNSAVSGGRIRRFVDVTVQTDLTVPLDAVLEIKYLSGGNRHQPVRMESENDASGGDAASDASIGSTRSSSSAPGGPSAASPMSSESLFGQTAPAAAADPQPTMDAFSGYSPFNGGLTDLMKALNTNN